MNLSESESIAFWVVVFGLPSMTLVSIGAHPLFVAWIVAIVANYLLRQQPVDTETPGETVYEYRHAPA